VNQIKIITTFEYESLNYYRVSYLNSIT